MKQGIRIRMQGAALPILLVTTCLISACGGGSSGGGSSGGSSGGASSSSSSSSSSSASSSASSSSSSGAVVTTADVDCAYSENTLNATVGIASSASWGCAGTERTLSANGVPDHDIGTFPNAGNPNTLSAQSISWRTPLNPAETGADTAVKRTAFALNGVKFDPGTAQTCTSDCANNGKDNTGAWTIEALGQSYFAFGVDQNNAHVQPNGAYHYHGMPEEILKKAGNTGQTMTLIGWAADGFPVYARYDHADPTDASSAIKTMSSSWRLKTTPDAGRPATSIAPMGTFTQDYEYVAGLGDLDECNGRFGVTPEFPGGIYHYDITDDFPYVPRCAKGSVLQDEGANG